MCYISGFFSKQNKAKKIMLKFLQKLSNTENYIVIATTYLLLL